MRQLPGGTVTFLFTDGEGSTKLLHELGADGYAAALAEHRRVVREAVARHGGVEVDTQGDAFFVAFPTAPGALAAAREATDELAEGLFQVRMGVHTGTPVVTEEGYVGADVHRAARVAAAGHGGQVLVSAATRALADGFKLRDLGEHRFKDLAAPERVFQLGEGAFPPLQSLYRTNLPVPATPFLGRERELREVVDLLAREGVRLLTLTGPGGTGKTRLALQAAAEAAEAFPDGIWWVPLAPLRDVALTLPTVAQALDVKEEPDRPLVDTLTARLAGKTSLLLLDNAEHLLPGLAADIARLRDTDGPTLLVTSRERLQLQGERVWAVPTLAAEEGIALFLARAAALGAEVARGADLVELCEQLDNLPLALELAAARTPLFSTEQLLERMAGRLDLLKGGRDVDPRQQTLRATIEWSHELLAAEEQQLFARLAVFAGGCTAEAAEQVCGADPDTLQSLLDKSLIRRRDGITGPRYWMLETVGAFANERLDESGEREEIRQRHAGHFAHTVLAQADAVQGDVMVDPQVLNRYVEAEQGNLRAALDWARAAGEPELELAVLTTSAGELGQLAWARERLDDALSRARDVDARLRVHALTTAGRIAQQQGDVGGWDAYLHDALELARRLDDARLEARVLVLLAGVQVLRGNLPRANELLAEGERLARAAGDEGRLDSIAAQRASFAIHKNDLEEARQLSEHALQRYEAHGDLRNAGEMRSNLGIIALRQGRYDDAGALLARSLLAGGDRNRVVLCCTLEAVAAVLLERGRPEDGARLVGAANRWREDGGLALEPFEAALAEETQVKLRERLGGAAYAAADQQGRDMGAALAISLAIELLDPERDAATPWDGRATSPPAPARGRGS